MIQDYQHVGIVCRNLEASTCFYQRLGLEVITPPSKLDEDAIARAFHLPGGHVKLLHMAPTGATSGVFLDLVQWLDPPSTGDAYAALNHVGINRLAFRGLILTQLRQLCGTRGSSS